MIRSSRFTKLSVVLLALLTSSALGLQPEHHPPTDKQRGIIYGDLWMQTSAEYVACCLQIYHLAGDQVELDVRQMHHDDHSQSPTTQTSTGNNLPSAVVMDLDETVLDNATLQSHLYLNGIDYSETEFNRFVTDNFDSIRLVPGAEEFIRRAESLGITVVYITNRAESIRGATVKTLAQWGVSTTGLESAESTRLLMQTSKDSAKKPRRDLVRAKYNVIAYFGDQLGDFSDEFALSPNTTAEGRVEDAYNYQALWGTRWFVLPNPVYGQWQMVLSGDPAQYLRRAKEDTDKN
jgi:5'-nucleotidase (lipoprotein e(P4) family)